MNRQGRAVWSQTKSIIYLLLLGKGREALTYIPSFSSEIKSDCVCSASFSVLVSFSKEGNLFVFESRVKQKRICGTLTKISSMKVGLYRNK